MRVTVRELPGRGKGLVATDTIAAGETVLHEVHPLCRAQLSAPLLELQEETALLVQMGYVEFWPHAVKDNSRINHSCEPNVRVHLGADGALSVLALRELRAGEEVLDNYLAQTMTHGADADGRTRPPESCDAEARLEMRRQLADRWRFQCTCALCEREGPVPARTAACAGW